MNTVYEVTRGRGMTGGRVNRYLNVEIDRMKEVAVRLIQVGLRLYTGRSLY